MAELSPAKGPELHSLAVAVLDATPPATPATDWSEYCSDLAERMMEVAGDILTSEQLERLRVLLSWRIEG